LFGTAALIGAPDSAHQGLAPQDLLGSVRLGKTTQHAQQQDTPWLGTARRSSASQDPAQSARFHSAQAARLGVAQIGRTVFIIWRGRARPDYGSALDKITDVTNTIIERQQAVP
jgi:hypothetical protein